MPVFVRINGLIINLSRITRLEIFRTKEGETAGVWIHFAENDQITLKAAPAKELLDLLVLTNKEPHHAAQ